jgi:hypothetical protein
VIFLLLLSSMAFSQSGQKRFHIESNDVTAFWKAFSAFQTDTTLNPFHAYLSAQSKA